MRGQFLVGCALLVASAQSVWAQQPPPAGKKIASTQSEEEIAKRELARERKNLNEHEAALNVFIDRINAQHRRIDQMRKKIEAGDPPPPAGVSLDRVDEMFTVVVNELDEVVDEAIDAAEQEFRDPRKPPKMPASLGAQTRNLTAFQPQVDALEKRRQELVEKAAQKARFVADLQTQRAIVLRERALQLNRIRLQLLWWISDGKRSSITGFNSHHVDALHSELLLFRLEATFWAHKRLQQLSALPTKATNISDAGAFAWKLFELVALLLLLRWMFGSWDRWMQLVIAAMGRGMHLSGWTLTFARFAELARSFGPPGLVLITAIVAYNRLGATSAPIEAQVAYVAVFWLALLRTQLRFVQAAAKNIGTRAIERERQQREIELVESLDADSTGPVTPPADAKAAEADKGPSQPAWQLVGRTWTIITRYAAIFILADALIELAVGKGVAYRALTRLAWWGAVPLTVILLLLWRDNIVAWYRGRSTNKAMNVFVERHAHRVYGPVVVLVALVVLIALRVASFVKEHLSNLDSTKRLLAFLFRRRVEKHARERGHVLHEPHELPKEIIVQFPTGPLNHKHRPVRPPLLDEIKAQFERWTETKSEGSIALVGASGMGKTTVLRMLEKELGTEVIHGRVMTKVTGVGQMVGTVARVLKIDGDLSTVKEIVSAIQDDTRLVIALDDCHNLFLRKIGGFEAWEAFTQVVNESCDNVFWVCSFNEAAWEYLNDISDRVSYFRQVVHMPPWTDEEIRRLILTRTRRARYRPNFTDLLVSRVEGVKVSTQIIGTAHGYFRLLWDFTNGNPRLAVHFWLRSLVPDTEKKRVRVHLFAAPSVAELEDLSDDIAFVLAAIVEHENVTADELATICNMPAEFCRFALRYLREGGYLHRDPATGRTYLSFHWQQTVIRYLKRKHLLYS